MDPVNSAQDPLEVCFNTEMHLKKKKNKTKQNKNADTRSTIQMHANSEFFLRLAVTLRVGFFFPLDSIHWFIFFFPPLVNKSFCYFT